MLPGPIASRRRPTNSGFETPHGRSKENAVRLIQPWTRDLAAKHSQFVAEHHDLELLELARVQTQRRHGKRTTEQQVQQNDATKNQPPLPRSDDADSRAAIQLRRRFQRSDRFRPVQQPLRDSGATVRPAAQPPGQLALICSQHPLGAICLVEMTECR